MNRRGFLRTLGLASAAYALDPELALWVPGRKTFFLPSPAQQAFLLRKGDWVFWPGGAPAGALAERVVVGDGGEYLRGGTEWIKCSTGVEGRGLVGVVADPKEGLVQVYGNTFAQINDKRDAVWLDWPVLNGERADVPGFNDLAKKAQPGFFGTLA